MGLNPTLLDHQPLVLGFVQQIWLCARNFQLKSIDSSNQTKDLLKKKYIQRQCNEFILSQSLPDIDRDAHVLKENVRTLFHRCAGHCVRLKNNKKAFQ